VKIHLTWFEVAMAANVGVMRQLAALRAGRPDRHGYQGLGWTEHCEGACGELVVAKALGTYWSGSVNTFKVPDLGGNLQVRTRSEDNYELIVRINDSNDDRFVLVTGRAPIFHVRGWISGGAAKREEWLQTHAGRPAAYFVPQIALQPMHELII
jgi:hypothetical protein